jgi:FlgN protein.
VAHVDYQHLSTLLWREQELLDLLLFKAEEKQYLILSGKTRWLARIAHEIEVVLDQLRTLEVERAAATEAIAVRLGTGVNPRCASSPRPPRPRGTTCWPGTTRHCWSWSPTCAASPTPTAASSRAAWPRSATRSCRCGTRRPGPTAPAAEPRPGPPVP